MTDPRLKLLENSLRKNNKKSNIDGKQTVKNTIQSLCPNCSFDKVLDNPLFYEKPVSEVPIMTEQVYLNSLKSKNVPKVITENLSLVDIEYRGFCGKSHHGQVVIHKDLVDSIKKIFKRIFLETNFPITSIIPLSSYNWDSSVKYNNSGAFDWRFVSDSDEISDHAFGTAIDINQLINPWIKEDNINSQYDPNRRGTLHPDSAVVKIFEDAGWEWGGRWKRSKDLQHFSRSDIPKRDFGKVKVDE